MNWIFVYTNPVDLQKLTTFGKNLFVNFEHMFVCFISLQFLQDKRNDNEIIIPFLVVFLLLPTRKKLSNFLYTHLFINQSSLWVSEHQTRGRFHKSQVHGANHRDSSIKVGPTAQSALYVYSNVSSYWVSCCGKYNPSNQTSVQMLLYAS